MRETDAESVPRQPVGMMTVRVAGPGTRSRASPTVSGRTPGRGRSHSCGAVLTGAPRAPDGLSDAQSHLPRLAARLGDPNVDVVPELRENAQEVVRREAVELPGRDERELGWRIPHDDGGLELREPALLQRAVDGVRERPLGDEVQRALGGSFGARHGRSPRGV